tara:strand:+ start:515 stop:1693 length:1179 start_codon:yes stop_codon:yes gene_type:complete
MRDAYLPVGLYVPLRGRASTTHADTGAKSMFSFTLEEDQLFENILITITGEHSGSKKRVGYQIPCMVVRRSSDNPDYSVLLGSQSWMTDEDPDIEVIVAANGDAGVVVLAMDSSGDAGQIDWVYQVWTLDARNFDPSPAPSLLLDLYPNARVAYSLRKLKTGVTSVVRIRRSSDNAEQDFTADEVTDGTLTTFTGANDGFVVTWYDQSGGGNDATQSTASSQPQIVSAGSVILDNGLPCLDFLGTKRLILSGAQLNASASDFSTYCVTGSTGAMTIYDIASRIQCVINRTYSYFYDVSSSGTGLSNAAFSLLEYYMLDPSSGATYRNGTLIESSLSYTQQTITSSGADSRIGSNQISGREMGKMSELIVYPSDQTANRSAISSSINSHYSIY